VGAVRNGLSRLLGDESGQDLIEYMLLTSFIAIAGYLGIQVLGSEMNTTYRRWDSATQGAWEVPDPVPVP
jgi:Flp pilus assembly pilin Flp